MDELTLSLAALPHLSGAALPSYVRADLRAGIVHIGVGNFHRAHMAVYLDRLMNQGLARDWAIIGTGVTDHDARMRAALEPQDWLSTVVEQTAEEAQARVTGVMVDFIAPGDRAGILAAMADPAVRIVSLTVTEGGYFIDPATGAFDAAHPAIRADAATPDQPRTAFGLILAALRRRRDAGLVPFTVLSCDNVPHNGVVTRNAVAGLARLSDPALADWVTGNVAFPNGMVDRIATVTNDRERGICRSQFGIDDAWPVFCEDYIQWVLEDHFPAGRPPLEQAGVTFVDDVTPFENMKIRILNGGHAIIAYPAGLMDIHFVHEAMQNPLIAAFLARLEREEILPVVPPVPGVDLHDYVALIEGRFANPAIGDTVRRLCLDGSNRQPKFIVPTIADRLAQGLPVQGLALESALWCRYCLGLTDSGAEIAPNDPAWDRLQAQARRAVDDPAAWLDMRDVYGATADDPAFRTAFAHARHALTEAGTEAVLRRYLDGTL
ncbi:mannitol dehydrogenase family protein [Halodurantibacterium flavum]|uniref:Mannitol dehydrogenase family protein n=1 Tax=Halodurantibacterium flavum TaxID=1382802 RepID=A0ABW4S7X1_9RHOB